MTDKTTFNKHEGQFTPRGVFHLLDHSLSAIR